MVVSREWTGEELHSNCDEVELFLNGKSLGKKKMERYGHLEWQLAFLNDPQRNGNLWLANGGKIQHGRLQYLDLFCSSC